jgi:hypothetical protein
MKAAVYERPPESASRPRWLPVGAVVVLIRQRRRRVAVRPGEVAEPRLKGRAVTINRSPDEVDA